jgi:opacity protein-like surface antigen
MEDQMSVQKWVVMALVMGSTLASEASAQNKAVGISVRGGVFNGVTELDEAGTADFKKTGYNAGVGINLDLTKFFAIRADANLARNELQIDDVETGQDMSRVFYDAALQFQYPINGFKPYLFVGAGAVRLHAVGQDLDDKTEFAGTAGLGVSYTVPGTNLAFGIEGKSWLYDLPEDEENEEFTKTQFEASWNAVISYRIPLGSQQVRASR